MPTSFSKDVLAAGGRTGSAVGLPCPSPCRALQVSGCLLPSRGCSARSAGLFGPPEGTRGKATSKEKAFLEQLLHKRKSLIFICFSESQSSSSSGGTGWLPTSPFSSQKRTKMCSRHCWVSLALTPHRYSGSLLKSHCKPEKLHSSATLSCPYKKIFFLLLCFHPPLQKWDFFQAQGLLTPLPMSPWSRDVALWQCTVTA